VGRRRAPISQPNRPLHRCRTQVHITLSRDEVAVSGEFLYGPRCPSTHRQMRAGTCGAYSALGI